MIIIPLNTDAPIYYWPWMTLVLIATNAVTFFLTGFGRETDGWLLQFGNGLHPLEWLASNFLHFGWLHLIGNMVFLWGFGLIVEGKVGWWRFLLLYLAIGVLGAAFIQLVMLGRGDDGTITGGGGSSLIIFGLLAVCMIWAPKNELDVFLFFGIRAMTVEISNLTFGIWYLAEQLFYAWLSGFSMGSSVGHLVGAFWGAAIGVAMLKLGWVDCENWDLFALWSGRLGQPVDLVRWQDSIEVTHSPKLDGEEASGPTRPLKKKAKFRPSIYLGASKPKRRKPRTTVPPAKTKTDQSASEAPSANRTMSESSLPSATLKVLDQIRELLRAGKPQAALSEYRKRLRIVDQWALDADDLQALADGLFKLKLWNDATPLLEEFIERFPARADAARIKLAAICCEVQNRPLAAIKLLDQVELDDLPDSIRGHIAQIRQKSERLLDDETFELDGKSW
jgi:membrane associated rhomboid family serine protease